MVSWRNPKPFSRFIFTARDVYHTKWSMVFHLRVEWQIGVKGWRKSSSVLMATTFVTNSSRCCTISLALLSSASPAQLGPGCLPSAFREFTEMMRCRDGPELDSHVSQPLCQRVHVVLTLRRFRVALVVALQGGLNTLAAKSWDRFKNSQIVCCCLAFMYYALLTSWVMLYMKADPAFSNAHWVGMGKEGSKMFFLVSLWMCEMQTGQREKLDGGRELFPWCGQVKMWYPNWHIGKLALFSLGW